MSYPKLGREAPAKGFGGSLPANHHRSEQPEREVHPMTDTRLLDAVDALTQPDRRKVIQDGPVGSGLEGQKTVTVVLPSLLDQLDEAIRGSIGIGGSGSLASERNMLDADALYKLVMISNTIKEWARGVKATVHPKDAGPTLRAWYVKYMQTPHPSDEFYIKKLHQWEGQIRAKLDPPRVRELPDDCPACGADSWWNPSDKMKYLHPLVVEYRPTGPDMIQEARALCRACEEVWGVRQLAYDLELAGGDTPGMVTSVP